MRPVVSLICALAALLTASKIAAAEEGRGYFEAVDIYIDSLGAPLAAYQIRFSDAKNAAKIVGIEGGQSASFREPPFYDPRALQRDRVIIAAFSLAPAEELPKGKTRIATIHVWSESGREHQFHAQLQTAGRPDGGRISARVTFEERRHK